MILLLNDFSYHCYHRAAHRVSLFWASHTIHHSSGHYNILTSLRLPWTSQFSGQFLFWIWMPFLGFSPNLIMFIYGVSQLYQSWLHTEAIKKLPWYFEYVFNTPSHHRVHHGSNPNYIDKNFGGVLVIWDRLFGTFREEDEKPIYGVTKKIKSFNPVIISFNEWICLFNNLLHAGSVKNAINYFVQPPGWIPGPINRRQEKVKKEHPLQAGMLTSYRKKIRNCFSMMGRHGTFNIEHLFLAPDMVCLGMHKGTYALVR